MELKGEREWIKGRGKFGLNCTFMELKGIRAKLCTIRRSSLNCTFMELKEPKKQEDND